MIGRLVLAALIAGMAAGFIYGGVQHVQTTPLILAAEVYETAPAHDHAAAATDPAALTTQLRPMNMKKRSGPLPMAGRAPFQPPFPR